MTATCSGEGLMENIMYTNHDEKNTVMNSRNETCRKIIECKRKNFQESDYCEEVISYGSLGRVRKKCFPRTYLTQTPHKTNTSTETKLNQESPCKKTKRYQEPSILIIVEESPVISNEYNQNVIEDDRWQFQDNSYIMSSIDHKIDDLDEELAELLSYLGDLDHSEEDVDTLENEAISAELEEYWRRNSVLSLDMECFEEDVTSGHEDMMECGGYPEDCYLEDDSVIINEQSLIDSMLDDLMKDVEMFENEKNVIERDFEEYLLEYL